MPRIPALTNRDDVPEEVRPIYDEILGKRGGRIPEPTAVMLHAPEVARAAASLRAMLQHDSSLSPAEQELTIITVARCFNNDYVWGAHTPAALAAGVSQPTIDAINARAALNSATPAEAIIIRFVREVIEKERVSDETFDAAHARHGDRGIIEMIALMARYVLTSFVVKVAELDSRPERPRLA